MKWLDLEMKPKVCALIVTEFDTVIVYLNQERYLFDALMLRQMIPGRLTIKLTFEGSDYRMKWSSRKSMWVKEFINNTPYMIYDERANH